ncbi:uncharacterized protein GVI51_I00583 [Nakaseomyces glabratus]|uniref:Uncharacterized protein n=1 Tax=Candida glabrata (strain ATCC 2001 / BCRC 20586 / JCM 3761 / NBRC 0622 / NRRL Y-65 / CBS 138) TaxID=284593 RepID=Q6FR57_CANGA|nr:uncharacterized protein CAGL0I00770g [Nakaseomyces glabratus]KAH7599543.1 hypothetical protein J7294_02558 [Nakaseomyces glabratus]KAH7604374.1 hypothetical protein J7293_02548 [Nakaseomyces glabratus]QHS66932.1 uncharacterized protein GVI51_I00583 [Nakaseomyces glabratus]CAG60224.1 unnamed protein product [Nakaseomyces glabratus]|eukprot:XP_447287.1 uncharacterized protein CAGL0I00770g [[Candida] glabrata]
MSNIQSVINPMEDSSTSRTKQDEAYSERSMQTTLKRANEIVTQLESMDTVDHGFVKKDVLDILRTLADRLNESTKQVQQLKYKNLLLSNKTSNENQMRHEVEENLKTQQFEKLKSQLYVENVHLNEQLHIKENKVTKYKKKIIAKNKHINQLMRLLNQTPQLLDSSQSESSMISNAREDTEEADTTIPITDSGRKAKPVKTETHMLNALGMLASHVLKDENKADDTSGNGDETRIEEDDSVNRTILQSEVKSSNQEIMDRSPTFARSLAPILPLNKKEELHSLRVVLPNIPRPEMKLDVKLPVMKRFNTLDGSVKDIS